MSTEDCAMNRAFYPLLESADVDASIKFYTGAGYSENGTMVAPDGKAVHTMLTTPCGRVSFMVTLNVKHQRGVQNGMSIHAYLPEEATIDETCEHFRKAGAKIVEEPKDQFWGERTFTFEDPDGYRWTLARRTNNAKYPDGMTFRQPAMA